MVMRCMENSDFKEGVRAMLVDRDMQPTWKPNRLEGLTGGDVTKYFESLSIAEELKL